MDATANAAPEGLDIRGFPTLIFFPADDKEGTPYNGERDLDSLIKFVKEHASHAVQEDGGKVDL
jgi:protein disulfide-isomerase A1